ncbi:septal ring lytic transglycosylase RlpA family protein [Sphingomonas sp.]|uniref:septal ring lytic transglycosylase RlpA family protein n=1 Tax=Sphingomonas sp. TaxID=28214 RepID=UPI0035B07846
MPLPKSLSVLPLLVAAAACSTTHYRPAVDHPVKIGRPYTVRGITYTPAAEPDYDMLGLAGWYGNESGNQTANGERFRVKAIAGAHTTLPLPSYVEVTALDTGRTILVRINDRGPFVRGRIIDLTRGAARQLGIEGRGIAPVRVRRVDPSERDRAKLRKGRAAPLRPDAPPASLAAWRAQLAGAPAASNAAAGR